MSKADTWDSGEEILELGFELRRNFSCGATKAKAAYRSKSLQWHPDRNPGCQPWRYAPKKVFPTHLKASNPPLLPNMLGGLRCGKECDDKMSEITKALAWLSQIRGNMPLKIESFAIEEL